MSNQPKVTAIVPCRNEEKYIEACLRSLTAQDYPRELLEILIVDGMSEDGTRAIVGEWSVRDPRVRLVDNPNRVTPYAWNIGIRAAMGEVVCLMGAHAHFFPDYVSQSVKYLEEYKADNVGGILKTIIAEEGAGSETGQGQGAEQGQGQGQGVMGAGAKQGQGAGGARRKGNVAARAIALVLSSMWGTGGAGFRVGAGEYEKPRWVDTVFGGCYRRELFERVGYFNEKMTRAQDMEFNLRLGRAGGKILLVPSIVAEYYPKNSMGSFAKHNWVDGFWSVYPMKWGVVLKLRHILPGVLTGGALLCLLLGALWSPLWWLLAAGLVLHTLVSLLAAGVTAKREGDARLVFPMVVAFFIRHFVYGAGSVWGGVKLVGEKVVGR